MKNILPIERSMLRKCKYCGAQIACLRNRKGWLYVVNVDYVVDGRDATFVINFHNCLKQAKESK